MIRKAREQDIDTCVEIESEAFGQERDAARHDLSRQVNDDEHLFFISDIQGEVTGFITAKHHLWNNSVYLERLFVRERFRNQGCGKELLNKIIEIAKGVKARKLFVDTGEKNKGAIRFYLKNGFKKAGHIKDFFNNPRDRNAVILAFDL